MSNIKISKVAVIDIDNTLWDFASVLYEEILKINPLMPPPDKWVCWDFWKEYLTAKDFYNAINKIHLNQDIFGVFHDAEDFLRDLKVSGYKIIIASHREEESRKATLNWLLKHKLPFDELHISFDKSILFHYCSLVVDDSPQILEKAKKININATGLEYAWNRGNEFSLFKTLTEIKYFLKLKY